MAVEKGAGAKPRRRVRRNNAVEPTTADAVDIAMAAAAGDGDLAHPGRALLLNQNRLVELQIATERLDQLARRMSIGLKVLLGLAGLLLVVGFGVMIWDAANSRGVIVESFKVPPVLAREGLAGEVVAAKIVDRLTAMRADTRSARAADDLETGWRDAFRVEIPRTGLLLSDVRKAFREWLGDDTRIGGEIYVRPQGLALTVRTDRGGSATFEGRSADIDALAAKAADKVYAETSPYLHAIYIEQQGRVAEARAELGRIAEGDLGDEERAWALLAIASSIMLNDGRCREALPVAERAFALGPDLGGAPFVLAELHLCLGHDQQVSDFDRVAWQAYRRSGGRGLNPKYARQAGINSEGNWADGRGDYGRSMKVHDAMASAGYPNVALNRADTLALMHDVRGSVRALQEWVPGEITEEMRVTYWIARANQARALGDWRAAARHSARAARAAQSSRGFNIVFPTQFRPLWAMDLARSGDIGGAETLIRGLPEDCYKCARARAVAADLRGDRHVAERWFAQAARLAPRLPFAFLEWGESRLRQGDSEGALRLFARATSSSPGFADAHQGRGDALMRLGRTREAVRAYAAAAERASRWGAVHVSWGRALWRLGRPDEARAKFRAAAAMDLSASDRLRLRRIWEAVRRPS